MRVIGGGGREKGRGSRDEVWGAGVRRKYERLGRKGER